MEKGKLIVFEGIDGSGKSAHYRRVCARLEAEKLIEYRLIAFADILLRKFFYLPEFLTAYFTLLLTERT